MVEHHQQPRPHARDLAAELGADRAAGAGDQHPLVLEVGADAVELHHHRLAAEHVLDPDLAQLAGELDAAAQELEHGRQGADLDVALAALGDHLAAQHAGRGGDRDHDLVRGEPVEDRADLVGRAEHLEPLGAHAALARVVVEEADRAGAEVRVQLQLADDHLPAGAGADDEHLARRGARAARRGGRSASERRASRAPPRNTRREQEVEDHDRARQAVVVGLGEREDEHHQGAGDRQRADQRPEVGEPEVAPPLLVQAEELDHERLAERDEHDRAGEHRLVAVRDPPGHVEEAQLEGEREGGGGEQRVGAELERPPPVDRVGEAGHRGPSLRRRTRRWRWVTCPARMEPLSAPDRVPLARAHRLHRRPDRRGRRRRDRRDRLRRASSS